MSELVLVSGSSRGLGASMAKTFSDAGFTEGEWVSTRVPCSFLDLEDYPARRWGVAEE